MAALLSEEQIFVFFYSRRHYGKLKRQTWNLLFLQVKSHLTADVVVRLHAKVPQGDGTGQVDSGQQPAHRYRQQAAHAEEDEGAARAARGADHQDDAQQQQKRQKAERGGPPELLVEFVRLEKKGEEVKFWGLLFEINEILSNKLIFRIWMKLCYVKNPFFFAT